MKFIRINDSTLVNPEDIAEINHGTSDIIEQTHLEFPPEMRGERVAGHNTWLRFTMKTTGETYSFSSPQSDEILADFRAAGMTD